MDVALTHNIFLLNAFQELLLFPSVDGAGLDERHRHLELALVGVRQAAMEKEAALPRRLRWLAVLEVVSCQVVLPAQDAALSAESVHLPKANRKLVKVIMVNNVSVVEVVDVVHLLPFWVIEGDLAMAEWPKASVLEAGQVKCFEVHLCF